MNTTAFSGSRTLPSNTITNLKEDLKGITTRSGNAYQGPMIPTTSSPLKVVERETEVTKDTVPPTNNRSTKDVQPLVVQIETPIPNSEPVVAPIAEPIIAPINVLILMLKFGPTIKILLINKEKLFELAITLLNEHCSVVLLKKLPEKFGDPVVDFDADPRVPLVLGRSFLKTERSLVDVYKGELTLRVGKEAVTFNLDQTLRYSANYDVMSVNRIDLIDIACEEYSQD
nr:reverse transcriptase domain-containing protein [Tanacetum cinerariifolium]